MSDIHSIYRHICDQKGKQFEKLKVFVIAFKLLAIHKDILSRFGTIIMYDS